VATAGIGARDIPLRFVSPDETVSSIAAAKTSRGTAAPMPSPATGSKHSSIRHETIAPDSSGAC
jgi:hypothetical protein